MIDKMYIMFPSFNYDKESNNLEYIGYDSENKTKEGLQNRLIELYKSVLLNEKVIPEVMTPIDFDFMKNDIRNIHRQPTITNLSLFNPLKDINTRYGFLAGQAGVGQQANALMAHVLGSMSELSLTNFNVPNSNNKLDLQYSNKLSTEDIKYYKKALSFTNEQIKDLESIKIGNSLSAVLNAFVDIAKDPYITEAGWTTMTTNTGNLLLRYGVHPFYVNALLSQTVIQDYVEFSQRYEKSDSQSLSTLDAFIEQEFGKDTWKNYNKKNVLNDSLELLRNQISKKGSDEHRMNTLYSFLYFQDGSKALQKSVNASKFMVNGAGKNITSLQISKNAVNSILENEDKLDDNKIILNGFQSLFQNPNGSESMFSRYYTNIVLGVDKIVKGNPKLFLSANSIIQNSFNEIAYDLSGDKLLDNELGDELEIYAYSYLMSGFQPLNITIAEKTDLLTNFVNQFKEFQKDNNELYSIIDTLVVKPGVGKIDYITLNNRIKSPEIEESLTNSFSDLLDKEPGFAEKLIKYSFLTSGFSMNPNQFFTHIPSQWMMRNNINRYIIDTNDEYNNQGFNDSNMIDQFYLSNIDNTKYVKNVTEGQIETLVKTAEFPDGISIRNNGFIMKKPGKQGYFKVKSTESGVSYYKLLGYTGEGKGVYTRFITNIEGKYTDIQPLNKKDKKGNRIYGYSREGIILKPSSEAIGKLATVRGQKILNDLAIISRDAEYHNEIIPNEVKVDNIIEIDNEMIIDNKNLIQFEEEQSSGYANRTRKNASADVTLAFAADFNTAGEKLTKNSVLNQGKKYVNFNIATVKQSDFVNASDIVKQLNEVNATSINIAGNGIYTLKNYEWTQEQLDQYIYELLRDVINNKDLKNPITLIRTGGQTGVDEAGGKAGIKLGIPTKILAPKGWLFRNINNKDVSDEKQFKERFGEYVYKVDQKGYRNMNVNQLSLFDKNNDWQNEDNDDTCVPF